MTPQALLQYIINECDTRISQCTARGISAGTLTEFREFLANLRDFIEGEA